MIKKYEVPKVHMLVIYDGADDTINTQKTIYGDNLTIFGRAKEEVNKGNKVEIWGMIAEGE